MKKILSFIIIASSISAVSCTERKEKTTKETIIVPQKTTVVKEPQKSTSISVDKNGVKVKSNKVNVSIEK